MHHSFIEFNSFRVSQIASTVMMSSSFSKKSISTVFFIIVTSNANLKVLGKDGHIACGNTITLIK